MLGWASRHEVCCSMPQRLDPHCLLEKQGSALLRGQPFGAVVYLCLPALSPLRAHSMHALSLYIVQLLLYFAGNCCHLHLQYPVGSLGRECEADAITSLRGMLILPPDS